MVSAAAVGQRERITQKRVIRFFVEELKYQYLGDWHTRANNRNIEPALLTAWLEKRGVAAVLIPGIASVGAGGKSGRRASPLRCQQGDLWPAALRREGERGGG